MFWSKPLVSDEMRDWIDECFHWYESNFGISPTPVLPTRDFFSAEKGTDLKTAQAILSDIKRALNFHHQIELLPIDTLPAEYRHNYQDLSQIAGTFQETEDSIVIRYDTELMHRPIQFISTLAHEVMHGQLARREHEMPGGAEAHELATDLCCIVAGFGVFQLQAADDAGWAGYLSQPTRAHALAYFLQQRSVDNEVVNSHLSQRCQKLLKRARQHL